MAIISKFTSSSGLHTIIWEEVYVHGHQSWTVNCLRADGAKATKHYLSRPEAESDFNHLKEVLTTYASRDITV